MRIRRCKPFPLLLSLRPNNNRTEFLQGLKPTALRASVSDLKVQPPKAGHPAAKAALLAGLFAGLKAHASTARTVAHSRIHQELDLRACTRPTTAAASRCRPRLLRSQTTLKLRPPKKRVSGFQYPSSTPCGKDGLPARDGTSRIVTCGDRDAARRRRCARVRGGGAPARTRRNGCERLGSCSRAGRGIGARERRYWFAPPLEFAAS